jgi:CheY-like chemotaxis protein
MRVAFVAGQADLAEQRLERLRALGHDVWAAPRDGAAAFRALKQDPPDACVIDLSGRPSHGRDLALALREAKATRGVALVFVDGTPEAIARLRGVLPDATFATWRGLRGALARAVARPPVAPVVPSSRLAGYSGTPLPKKLGIKPGMTVGLVGAPADFEATLGTLPEDAVLKRSPRAVCDLLLWFAASRAEVESRIEALRAAFGAGGLWICWRKQASGSAGDLTQADVRRIGLARGLVDYKVCALDATWSGLKFARRAAAQGA